MKKLLKFFKISVFATLIMFCVSGCKQDPSIMYAPVFDSPTNGQHFKTSMINISGHLILSQTPEEKVKYDEAIKGGPAVETGPTGNVFVDGQTEIW